MEIVICVSSGWSTISNCGGMFTGTLLINSFLIADCRLPIYWALRGCTNGQSAIANRQSLEAIRFIPSQRKILAQSMALPVFRQENSAEIRMPVKDYSK